MNIQISKQSLKNIKDIIKTYNDAIDGEAEYPKLDRDETEGLLSDCIDILTELSDSAK